MIKRLVNYLLDGGVKNKTFVARKNSENLLYRVDFILDDKLHVTEYNNGQFRQTKYNLIKHLRDIEGDFSQKIFTKKETHTSSEEYTYTPLVITGKLFGG